MAASTTCIVTGRYDVFGNSRLSPIDAWIWSAYPYTITTEQFAASMRKLGRDAMTSAMQHRWPIVDISHLYPLTPNGEREMSRLLDGVQVQSNGDRRYFVA